MERKSLGDLITCAMSGRQRVDTYRMVPDEGFQSAFLKGVIPIARAFAKRHNQPLIVQNTGDKLT